MIDNLSPYGLDVLSNLSPLQKTHIGTLVGKFSAIDPEGDGLIFELGGLEGYHDMDIIHGYVPAGDSSNGTGDEHFSSGKWNLFRTVTSILILNN